MRNEQGKFVPKPAAERLGKAIGVRLRMDLLQALQEIALAENVTPTEWCRRVLESAIASTKPAKRTVKKSKDATVSGG